MAIYEPVDISKMYRQKLFNSICIPSSAHSYSLCIEYMKKWFTDKFDEAYFKSIYVDGKHIFDDFRTFNKKEMLKRQKPALAIQPQIDVNFDRDKLDMYMGDMSMYLSRCNHRDAFFKDLSKSTYIAIAMELILMNFSFKIKLSTKAQALDVLKYMKMAFRVGSTQGNYIDMDFHVPYDLMIQVAQDSGFTVREEGGHKVVTDIIGFVGYLNRNSQLPFLYKYRSINGNNEFFIRLENMYVHISSPDISVDDGERENQILTNFIIEMNSTVRFPCPKFYSYFSYNEHLSIREKKGDGSVTSHSISLSRIPLVNEKQWNFFMCTDYTEEDTSETLKIKFDDILGDLRLVIDHTKDIYLSPSKFMDIKLFNNFKEEPIDIDWNEYLITTKNKMKDGLSHIVIYIDTAYMNNQLSNIKEYNKGRLK